MKYYEIALLFSQAKENRPGVYTHPALMISIFAVMLALEFVLVSLSYHLMCFITVPFIGALAICYKGFVGIWKSYSYSMVYIVILPTVVLVLAVLFGGGLREALFSAAHSLLTFI